MKWLPPRGKIRVELLCDSGRTIAAIIAGARLPDVIAWYGCFFVRSGGAVYRQTTPIFLHAEAIVTGSPSIPGFEGTLRSDQFRLNDPEDVKLDTLIEQPETQRLV